MKYKIKLMVTLLNFCFIGSALAQSNEEFLDNLNRQMRPLSDMTNQILEQERREAPQRAARQAEMMEQIGQMDCSGLDFMRKKYANIGDSAYRAAMSGSSAAAYASQAQAQQAYGMSQLYAEEMSRRCY